MRRAILAALLVFPLAGCALPGTGTIVAEPLPLGGIDNLVATTQPPTRQANELSIAVNPLDPLNIIATGKDYTPDEAGDCVWAGIYATKDGGLTWHQQNVPGSPWKRLKDPTAPQTVFTKFWCVTDPVVRFGPDGTAYWTVMPYQCDPSSGSKVGKDTHPDGGLNDWFWTCSAMYVLVSTDGGMTWPVDKAREVAVGPGLAHDKQWISVAPDGNTLVLCWDYAGADGGLPGLVPDPVPVRPPARPQVEEWSVVCSASSDKGASWSPPADATDKGYYPVLDHDATGRAWMALEGPGPSVLVASSQDGLKWTAPVKVADAKAPDSRNAFGSRVLHGSEFRVSTMPSIAVDRSMGPHSGRVYVAWFDHTPGHGETMLAWSDDGVTWSTPMRLNDDAGDADQFLQSVSVGPDGTVDASWMDRRDDPANHLYDAYYAYSIDGGVTFSPNIRVSSVSSDERHSHHQNGMVFLGDYRDMASTRGAATLTWVDTRHEKADVMVATVQRPSADAR